MKISMRCMAAPFFLLLVVPMLFVYSCNQAGAASPVPVYKIPGIPASEKMITWDELKQGTDDAKPVAQAIVNLIPDNGTWLPPVPPAGGTRAHVLSASEKAKILQLALEYSPVVQAQSNKDVLSIDERDFFWKSYSNADAVEVSNAYMEKQGISRKLDAYLGDKCYPGVFLLFHTQQDSFAYAGMNIVVDMEGEKVLYIEGFVTAAGFDPGKPSDVNPTSFTLTYWNDLLNPLNPNYDPSLKWGQEGTRFGPPWDNSGPMP